MCAPVSLTLERSTVEALALDLNHEEVGGESSWRAWSHAPLLREQGKYSWLKWDPLDQGPTFPYVFIIDFWKVSVLIAKSCSWLNLQSWWSAVVTMSILTLYFRPLSLPRWPPLFPAPGWAASGEEQSSCGKVCHLRSSAAQSQWTLAS